MRRITDYAFAVGKIRALERFLLKQEVFQEAIESGFNEALRLFVESDLYSEELLRIKETQQLEAVLNKELFKLKKLTSDLLDDKRFSALLELNSITSAQEIIDTCDSEFIQDYFRHLIDMHNIKSFLRLYILREPQEKLKAVLTCEGFMKKNTFGELYAQDLAVFLNRLQYIHKRQQIVDYAFFLKEAIEKMEKEKTFVYLEKAIGDFLLWVLQPAKYLSFGPEPIVAYYFAKLNEINLIRMIILAKLNYLSKDLMKRRLTRVYA